MENQKQLGWLEENIELKFEAYKTTFLNKSKSFGEKSVKLLFLHFEIEEDIDYDADDWEEETYEQVHRYGLGIFTNKEFGDIKDLSIYKWKWEPTGDGFFWEPEREKFYQLWNQCANLGEHFDRFLNCVILSKVAIMLKNDEELKPYFSDALELKVDIEYEWNKPRFDKDVPALDVREQIMEELASTEDNQKLLVSLWDNEIKGEGRLFLNELEN